MSDVAPGWYSDPTNPLQERLWDGNEWVDNVRPKPPTTPLANAPRPRSRSFTKSSSVISILGGMLTGLGVLLLLGVGISGNSDAMEHQSKIISPLLALGIPTLLIGLVLSNRDKTRASRGEINNVSSHDGGGVWTLGKTVVACIGFGLSPIIFVGLPLSLYSYFNNPVGTLSRYLGLAGVFTSIGLWLALLLG